MTIAKAFNEIAVAQGGTADTSGTIAGAIDALNDALAGSDLPKKPRIEDGIRVLGQYIGGGASLGEMQYIMTSESLSEMYGVYVATDADMTNFVMYFDAAAEQFFGAPADCYFAIPNANSPTVLVVDGEGQTISTETKTGTWENPSGDECDVYKIENIKPNSYSIGED